MAQFKDTSYRIIGEITGDEIKINQKLVGHIENNKVTDHDHNVIGYIDGEVLRNSRDSVVAKFNKGHITDIHDNVLGHYEGGKHTGAGGAAYLTLFKKSA